ncbi:MAG TPA: ATP-binding protein [Ktedonosporobacter sp.]|nr:ATP-binding protein [Ktedonosporobacter sp.]
MAQKHASQQVSNIDERKDRDAAIIRLASIVESSGDAIFGETLQGVITSWNSSAENLFGYTADEVLGTSLSLMIPPDRHKEVVEIAERLMEGEVVKNYETTRVRKDGTHIEVSVTVSPIRGPNGRIIAASTIVHDITEQKRMIEELATRSRELEGSNEDLAIRSRELEGSNEELATRSRELERSVEELATRSRELERSNKELAIRSRELEGSVEELFALNSALEQANQARSQFLSTMSHELRTPLASIMGFGEMLLEDAREAGWDPQQQSSLESILANSEHLLGLISDVLDLSKMEAGRMAFDSRQVDPRDLLSEVTAEVGSLAVKRNLFLRGEVQEGIGSLETSPGKLHQILLNLVSNAIKFTEHGGVTISASRAVLSGTGEEGVAFAVQDSGIGIPPDLHERIFAAFYQADMSYTRKAGGTGLGLSIASQLTALLGGTITVASAPGQGSTFTVTLPVKVAQPSTGLDFPRLHPGQQENALTPPPATREFAPAPPPDVIEGSGQPEAIAGPHDLILVVDDNAETIAIIKDALQDTPYTLIGVQDPLTVMELAQKRHPCAITLDVMMPQFNGWQLLHQLKDDPATASIPVVILSVLSEQTTGYVLGADDYLIKPFKKEVLRSTLQHLIEARRGPSAASRSETQQAARSD